MEIEEKGKDRTGMIIAIIMFSIMAIVMMYLILNSQKTLEEKQEKITTTTPYTKEWCNLKSNTNQQYFSCLDQIREKEINELKQKLEEKNVSP